MSQPVVVSEDFIVQTPVVIDMVNIVPNFIAGNFPPSTTNLMPVLVIPENASVPLGTPAGTVILRFVE